MSCDNRDTIPQGAVDPYHLRFDISNQEVEASDIDFAEVVSAEFRVRRPSGVEVSWVAQIESSSETEIRIAYAFQLDDLAQLGEFQVVPKLTTVGGGVLFASERQFTVLPEFKE